MFITILSSALSIFTLVCLGMLLKAGNTKPSKLKWNMVAVIGLIMIFAIFGMVIMMTSNI